MTRVVPRMKLCPFCGGEACIALGKATGTKDGWFAFCPSCNAHGPTGTTPGNATVRWNKRARYATDEERVIGNLRDVLKHAQWDLSDLDGMIQTYHERTVAKVVGKNRAGIEELEASISEFDEELKDDPNAWYDAVSSMTYDLMERLKRDCMCIKDRKKEGMRCSTEQ